MVGLVVFTYRYWLVLIVLYGAMVAMMFCFPSSGVYLKFYLPPERFKKLSGGLAQRSRIVLVRLTQTRNVRRGRKWIA